MCLCCGYVYKNAGAHRFQHMFLTTEPSLQPTFKSLLTSILLDFYL